MTRNFRLLWSAGLISITGDWALRVALPIYILRLTGSAAAVSAVVLAELVASLTAGTVAGAYVDRWDRRHVLVLVNALQALGLGPLLAVHSADRLWIVVAVAFAEAALAQFFVPAENALVPRLVPPDELGAANARNSLATFIGRLLGPAAGGLVTVSFGLGGAAVLDAVTFAVAATFCAMISGDHTAASERQDRDLRRELIEGVRAIGRNRLARAVLTFIAITSIGEGMMSTLFAVFVTRSLHAGSREMGWMLSAQALGGILGSLIGVRVAGRIHGMSLAWAGLALFGLIDLAIFNYPRCGTALWPVIVLFFLIGAPGAIGYAAMITLFQAELPDGVRGRAFAVIGVCSALAGMVGAGIAGALGQTVSAVDLLTAQGSGYVLAAILLRLMAGSKKAGQPADDRTTAARPAPSRSRHGR